MDLKTSNYFEVCGALDRRGIKLRDVAQKAGRSHQHVAITLRRHCGVQHQRGPQSADVLRILTIVDELLKLPLTQPSTAQMPVSID